MTIFRPTDFALRWRVGEIWSVVPAERDDGSDGAAFMAEVREFKSAKGANAYADEIRVRGLQAGMQVGVVQWLSDDDASAMIERLHAEGGTAT